MQKVYVIGGVAGGALLLIVLLMVAGGGGNDRFDRDYSNASRPGRPSSSSYSSSSRPERNSEQLIQNALDAYRNYDNIRKRSPNFAGRMKHQLEQALAMLTDEEREQYYKRGGGRAD